jgi:integrase
VTAMPLTPCTCVVLTCDIFGCLYYAGLRPSEALALRESDLHLPEQDTAWGRLRLSPNDPEVTTTWTDSGKREARQLKHRAEGTVRPAPCPPALVVLLRQHLETYGTGPDGRLFCGPRGGSIKESVYTEIWQAARRRALTPAQVASPLVARAYDLRHSCVSTWLASGVMAGIKVSRSGGGLGTRRPAGSFVAGPVVVAHVVARVTAHPACVSW